MVVVVGVLVNLNFCTRGMEPIISPERGGRKHPESTRLGHGAEVSLGPSLWAGCPQQPEYKVRAPNGNSCQPRQVLKIG